VHNRLPQSRPSCNALDTTRLATDITTVPSKLRAQTPLQLQRRYDSDYRMLHVADAAPAWMSPRHAAQALQRRMNQTALELLSRPKFWNSGLAETAMPLMPRTDRWPNGRALRIIDCDSGAISLFGNGSERHYDPASPDALLPEPADDEIILMRTGAHYSLIQRDCTNVIRDVPADGDCFFSCISLALGASPEALAATNLALRQSLVRLFKAEPQLMQFMAPDLPLPP